MAQSFEGQRHDHCDGLYRSDQYPVARGRTSCIRVSSAGCRSRFASANRSTSAIQWKFYLVFIIPGYLFAIGAWFILPNTRHLSLEQIAALFGDEVEIRNPSDSIKDSDVEKIEHAGGDMKNV